MSAQQELTARGVASLAILGLPVSLLVTLGIGLAVMAWAGCTHLSTSWVGVGAGLTVLSAGALLAGMTGNLLRTRRMRRLTEAASVTIDDPARRATLERLAPRLGAPVPDLRAIPLDSPLAFALLGPHPTMIVSTWVFDHLSDDEWEALTAHELAHMREDDRTMRGLGSAFFVSLKRFAFARGAWDRLEAAMEDAADHAVVTLLGTDEALRSARRKFLSSETDADHGWHQLLKPPTPSYQLALASIGIVATLPLLPFVVVPLCVSLCGV
jgi:Zn-dependent protease with chaperone function